MKIQLNLKGFINKQNKTGVDFKKRDPRSREMFIDNSISVISSIANPK